MCEKILAEATESHLNTEKFREMRREQARQSGANQVPTKGQTPLADSKLASGEILEDAKDSKD